MEVWRIHFLIYHCWFFCCRPSYFTGCSLLPAKLRALLASEKDSFTEVKCRSIFSQAIELSVPMKGKENLRMQTPKVNSILNTFRLVRMRTVQSEFHIQFLPLVFMCLMVMLSWRKSGKKLFFRFYVLYKLVKQLKMSFYMLVPFISGCNGKEIKETIIMIAWHVKKALKETCD